MGDFFTKVLELFVVGNKTALLRLLGFLCAIIIALPLVLNYFYKDAKLEQQIRNLKELNAIKQEEIHDEHLTKYYEKLIEAVTAERESLFGISIDNEKSQALFESKNIYKFISGSILWIFLFIIGLFIKQKTIGEKIQAQTVLFVLALVFGWVGKIIPTFSPFFVNIVGFPLLQLIIIIAAMIKKTNKKSAT
ncbi:hypothetical protein [Treponema endosymbiont of Eucomonympha sp.]|uniref:hypothetical protein n=1 Tax=Treponema endosymbiont of Eucomonympha sp. TaxID=1580831 RepID=UPI00078021D3|nr:hypothetical protein [Treponema endosymbiont of Eucomonympha sp.]